MKGLLSGGPFLQNLALWKQLLVNHHFVEQACFLNGLLFTVLLQFIWMENASSWGGKEPHLSQYLPGNSSMTQSDQRLLQDLKVR